jgi:hypothetical protein
MAAKKVKVWNRNKVDLHDVFKGEDIHIPAGDFIVMGRSQAIQFKGNRKPIQYDGMKRQTLESMKILELEPIKGNQTVEKEVFMCQMDGKEFNTKRGLDNYMKKNYPEKSA